MGDQAINPERTERTAHATSHHTSLLLPLKALVGTRHGDERQRLNGHGRLVEVGEGERGGLGSRRGSRRTAGRTASRPFHPSGLEKKVPLQGWENR